jgi:hypothetical protein
VCRTPLRGEFGPAHTRDGSSQRREEATRRLAATGLNTLPGEPPPARPLCRLLLRCTNTLIVLLPMIAVATAIVGDRTTTLAILAAALLNSIVSLTLRRRI